MYSREQIDVIAAHHNWADVRQDDDGILSWNSTAGAETGWRRVTGEQIAEALGLIVGAHVWGGHGDDHDTGVVTEAVGPDATIPHRDDAVFVSWASGMRTWTPAADLDEAPARK